MKAILLKDSIIIFIDEHFWKLLTGYRLIRVYTNREESMVSSSCQILERGPLHKLQLDYDKELTVADQHFELIPITCFKASLTHLITIE